MFQCDSQSFWPPPSSRLVVDWDTLFQHFTSLYEHYTSTALNSLQTHFLRTQLDPQGRGQVYKSGFLLFVRRYWQNNENRARFCKSKFMLDAPAKKKLGNWVQRRWEMQICYKDAATQQLNLLAMKMQAHSKEATKLQIESLRFKGEIDDQRQVEDSLVMDKAELRKGVSTRTAGFVSIGSDLSNDIPINSLLVNSSHLKLIITDGQLLVRDTSRSQRVTYVLDSPYKHVMVRQGLLMKIGLTNEWTLSVERIINTGPINLPQMLTLLNAHRIDYLGEIDQKIPEHMLIDLDLEPITPLTVQQLYQLEQHYPLVTGQSSTALASTSNKSSIDEEPPTLYLQLFNRVTQEKRQFRTTSTVIIGTESSCQWRLSDTHEYWRPIECRLRLMGKNWILENGQDLNLGNKNQNISLSSNGTAKKSKGKKGSTLQSNQISESAMKLGQSQRSQNQVAHSRIYTEQSLQKDKVSSPFPILPLQIFLCSRAHVQNCWPSNRQQVCLVPHGALLKIGDCSLQLKPIPQVKQKEIY